MFIRGRRLCVEAGAGGGAGGGGAGAGAGGTGAGAGGGTALGSEPAWETTVPVKFREGGKADGAINHGAIYKGYSELESAMRNVGKPPAKAEEYKFDLKEEHLLTPEALTGLRGKAHGAGFTQGQFELLANETLGLLDAASRELVLDLVGTKEDCDKELLKLWPDATKNSDSRKAANRAFKAYFGNDDNVRKLVGNNPKFMAGLAALGAELKEDAPATGAGSSGESPESVDAEIQKEMANPAYTNPFHKDHVAQKAKVTQLFEKRYGSSTPAAGVAAKAYGT